MNKESLEKKSRKDLLEIAKYENIVGRWDLRKDQLIDAILQASESSNDKSRYIRTAKVGTIIAFDLPDGSTKSAAIISRDDDQNIVIAETKYGAKYEVPFNNIIWVRTGSRWPKGIYKKLKGLV